MEPRVAIGEYDSGNDSFTLWNTSQNPHVARLVIAAFVGMAPEHKLRVIAPDVGGGFGSKIFIYPEEVACLWASKRTGRPVKWTSDRSEAFLADAHGRDHVTHAEMAFGADGKILALRAHTIANLGAYMSTFSSSVPTYLYGTCSPASTESRRSIARSTRSIPTPCRSTPIAAPAVRRRPSWSSG
jgi:carbon-monoxide dehydrogenase large subunit